MITIDWLAWEKESFEKAVKENKPILLDISATWCHWCHVMEDGTYASNEVIKKVSEVFVPVRVDTDAQPDINERYNQGGWPSTVFLTPSGEIITGGTYMAPEEFLEVSGRVVEIFRRLVGSSSIDLKETTGPIQSSSNERSLEEKRIRLIKYRGIFLKSFEEIVLKNFDPTFGGFGWPASEGPKFPQTEVLNYCLAKCQRGGDPRFLKLLSKSLEGMSEGGLFDHLEGGFFRYTTDAAWQNPHFEKMLLDNASLAKIYFDVYRLFGDRSFLDVSQKTLNFIKNWLYDPDSGGFFSSVAADEEYYLLASRGERLAFRQENKRPRVDETFYTNLNCFAAEYLFSVGEKEMSVKSFQKILRENQSPPGLFYHFAKGEQGFLPNLLIDQIAVARAWLSLPTPGVGRDGGGLPGPILADSSGEAVTGRRLWSVVMENFYDREVGGFWDRMSSPNEDFGGLKKPRKDLDENVAAIRILRELGYEEEAKKSLIEIFWLHQKPGLQCGALARLLLGD